MNQECIHSPPLLGECDTKGDHNNDDDDKCQDYDYDYSIEISNEAHNVRDQFATHFPQIIMHHHIYTYREIQYIRNKQLFCFLSSEKYTTFGVQMHIHRSPKEFIHLLLYSFMHLCGTIYLLSEMNIVHGKLDLFNNVLVTPLKDNTPIISDFTMSLDNLLSNSYNPSNIFIPLELHLFQFMSQNKLQSISEQNIEDVLYDVFTNHPLLAMDDAMSSMDYLSSIYINKPRTQIQHTVCEAAPTWDMYALCANYWMLLKKFQSFNFTKHVELCTQLFHINMNVNPKLRKNAIWTKNTIQKIFSSKRQ